MSHPGLGHLWISFHRWKHLTCYFSIPALRISAQRVIPNLKRCRSTLSELGRLVDLAYAQWNQYPLVCSLALSDTHQATPYSMQAIKLSKSPISSDLGHCPGYHPPPQLDPWAPPPPENRRVGSWGLLGAVAASLESALEPSRGCSEQAVHLEGPKGEGGRPPPPAGPLGAPTT